MKKRVKFLRFFDQNNIGSLPRVFLCSLAVLFFFYSMPHVINMNSSTEFKNNSKKVLAYTLNNENSNLDKDSKILDVIRKDKAISDETEKALKDTLDLLVKNFV